MEVVQFYEGAHVVITGGTGFMGRILIEKLLRCCPGIARVYLIIRLKKNKNPADRMAHLFKDDIFGVLRDVQPDFERKVTLIAGDCSELGLGISEQDRQLLTGHVTHVFHGAATVRFDEKLRKALLINVRGVQEILLLSKQCLKLKAVVHISTAYSHCPRQRIEEVTYQPPIPAVSALKLLESLNDNQLDSITPSLIQPWPNTYSFSKCIAEDVIAGFSDLPIAIVRPSIVIGCHKEPIPGWIDNVYGPTGVAAAIGTGLMRVMCANADFRADLVPVDMVVNSIICIAWRVGKEKKQLGKPMADFSQSDASEDKEELIIKSPKTIPVYNYVAAEENCLQWKTFREFLLQFRFKVCTTKAIWFPMVILTTNHTWFNILCFFLHIIPGYIVDSVLTLRGKSPRLVEEYNKLHKFSEVLSYFATNEWSFENSNTLELWSSLSNDEQEMFPFDMKQIDWKVYYFRNWMAIRTYILHDDPTTLAAARRRIISYAVAHFALIGLSIWIVYSVIVMPILGSCM